MLPSRVEKEINQSNEDITRDLGKTFFNDESSREYKYEYTVKEESLGKNAEPEERKIRKKHLVQIKDAQGRYEILEALLIKPGLTPEESQELQDLERKSRNHPDAFRYEEDDKMRILQRNKLKDGEISLKSMIQGIDQFFYHKNARNTALMGKKLVEWNNLEFMSKECKVDETAPSCRIWVSWCNPVDFYNKMSGRGYNIALAISGSHINAGGMWKTGSYGVEESIFVTTTVSVALGRTACDGFYELKDDAVIYVPKVIRMRKSREENYEFTQPKEWYTLSLFLVGDNIKTLDNDSKIDRYEAYEAKLRNLLQLVLFYGYNSVILSPIGFYSRIGTDIMDKYIQCIKKVIFDDQTRFYKRLRSISIAVQPDAFEVLKEEYTNSMGQKMQRVIDRNRIIYDKLQQLHEMSRMDYSA